MRSSTHESATLPHDLPLPDEGRTVWTHDVEMRVRVPPPRLLHSPLDQEGELHLHVHSG